MTPHSLDLGPESVGLPLAITRAGSFVRNDIQTPVFSYFCQAHADVGPDIVIIIKMQMILIYFAVMAGDV